MLRQFHDLFTAEPVLEALLVQGVGLRVNALVVEGMFAGRLDALYLEGQPSAVAGGVGEELYVITRAADGCDVLSVLMEMGIGCTLIDRRHGDSRLQLVEFRGSHRVELLTAHQAILRQGEEVVLTHAVRVRLCI